MPRWLKISVVLGASGALFVGLVIGGFVLWLHANRDQLRAKGRAAEAEGKQYGLDKSSHACIDESLTRLARTHGFWEQAVLGMFLKSCVQSAPSDPTLCEGVPATDDIWKTATWRNQFCAAHGKPGDQDCCNLVARIQEVCHPTP
jgi:hypothetical protein